MTQITIDSYSKSQVQQIEIPGKPKLSFEMLFIPGGTYLMGSDAQEALQRERPVHEVTVSDFYLCRHLVNQELWETVVGENPSRFQLPNHPVDSVSWNDCQKFIEKLNELTGQTYRLPSEAEWEYAARGGLNRQQVYAGSGELKEVGWYRENQTKQTHFVEIKRGNEFGLHDLSGELLEWCEDRWHENYEGAPTNGSAWTAEKSALRVLRGGLWGRHSENCRVSFRHYLGPQFGNYNAGLRLALSP